MSAVRDLGSREFVKNKAGLGEGLLLESGYEKRERFVEAKKGSPARIDVP